MKFTRRIFVFNIKTTDKIDSRVLYRGAFRELQDMSPPPGTSERLYRLYRLCCPIRWISAISMSRMASELSLLLENRHLQFYSRKSISIDAIRLTRAFATAQFSICPTKSRMFIHLTTQM